MPEETDFALMELDVLDRACPVRGRMMYICDHRYRRLHTLDGPLQLVCKLNHCPDRACPSPAMRPGAQRVWCSPGPFRTWGFRSPIC